MFKPPFGVSRQQVDYYRKTRKQDIAAISAISEKNALIEGYALKETRVYKLSVLAALLERDLLNGFIWLDQVKGIGSGPIAEIVDYEEFNAGEIAQYRGILDDIAKEVGDRIKNVDMKSDGKELQREIVIRYESNSDNAAKDAQSPATDQKGKKA